MTHIYLSDADDAKLKVFARLMRERGKMTVVLDDALIITTMAANGILKPQVQAGDHHKVILFSDKDWSWLVVIYQGFMDGNGLASLKIDRKYLFAEFCVLGKFNMGRAALITASLLAILQVHPKDVEMDWSNIEGKEG
jgi:hypothetical protein